MSMSETSPLFPSGRGSTERGQYVENGINASNTHEVSEHSSFHPFDHYVRPMLGELVATMLFVCVGVLSVQFAADQQAAATNASSVILCIAVGHGLAIALVVTALADVSGAHVNPAVTLGVLLSQAISPAKAMLYVIAQLSGGVLGAGLSKAILPSQLYNGIGGGTHTLGAGVTPGEGVLCEVVLTTLLVLTVLLSAVDPQTKSPLAPLAIGFAVVVDILAGAKISGASMNPARSFGPAVLISSETMDYWKYHYIYWVGPLLGAVAAAVFYRLILASRQKRLVFKS